MQEWQLLGLPSDAFSVANALITFKSRRWPLMVDPQGQANEWVKNLEADNKLTVLRPTELDYHKSLMQCIRKVHNENPVSIRVVCARKPGFNSGCVCKKTQFQFGLCVQANPVSIRVVCASKSSPVCSTFICRECPVSIVCCTRKSSLLYFTVICLRLRSIICTPTHTARTVGLLRWE